MKIQPTHSASFLYVCCIIIFTCLPRLLFAGGIKGKVTDSKGNTLPYATIYVKGTTIGTGANAEGEYFLNLGAGKYTIICQFMGFKQGEFTCTLADAATIVHDFKLPEESLDLKEVVIQSDAEDPAYAIMRKAIAKREYHLTQIKSFKTDIYLKGVIRSNKMPDKLMGKDVKLKTIPGIDSNGKGVLYLCEEEAEYYADGKKDRTIIHSVRESGNPNGFGFAQFPAVVTFYENNVNLMESSSRGYISPVSEHALFYYKYQLLGEFVENGHTVYKIKVIPRRLYEPVFNGTIYIVDDEWAIHSIDMYLTKNSNLDFMDTLGIKQLFLPLANGVWVAKNQLIYFSLNLFGFDVNGSIATVYNGQHINVALPDSIFANKLLSAYDKHANKKDTAYWSANRPIPLMADELTNYKIRDSALKVIQSERYRDSVRITRNLIKVNNLIMGNSSWSTKQYKNTFTLNPILFVASDYNESGMLNYNTEEGINFAPKIKWRHFIDTGKTLNTALAVRYGFFNTHFNSIAKIAYKQNDRTWRGRSWNIGVQGGKYVFQFNPENPVAPIFNSISTLFWRENDMKIYERYEGTGFVERNYGNGLKWDLRLAYQQRKVIHTYTDYSFFRRHVVSVINKFTNLYLLCTI